MILALCTTATLAQPVELRHLDKTNPTEIPVGTKTVTTLQFPRPIQGLMGYGLTTGNEPGTYQYTHPPGSRILTLRNLMPDKTTAITVLLGQDDLYVLQLKPANAPPSVIHLVEEGTIQARRQARPIDLEEINARKLEPGVDRLFNLLKLGRNERVFRTALPHLYKEVESRQVEFREDDNQIATVVTEVHRFPSEDAVFLACEIHNQTDAAHFFAPSDLQIRVGKRVYQSTLVDSAPVVDAHSSIPVHVILRGGVGNERVHLSVENEFRLVMPAYKTCSDDLSNTLAIGTVLEPATNEIVRKEGSK